MVDKVVTAVNSSSVCAPRCVILLSNMRACLGSDALVMTLADRSILIESPFWEDDLSNSLVVCNSVPCWENTDGLAVA